MILIHKYNYTAYTIGNNFLLLQLQHHVLLSTLNHWSNKWRYILILLKNRNSNYSNILQVLDKSSQKIQLSKIFTPRASKSLTLKHKLYTSLVCDLVSINKLIFFKCFSYSSKSYFSYIKKKYWMDFSLLSIFYHFIKRPYFPNQFHLFSLLICSRQLKKKNQKKPISPIFIWAFLCSHLKILLMLSP